MVWQKTIQHRVFEYDMCSKDMSREEILRWFDWADIIHYHNRYKRQEIFQAHNLTPPKKPSIIQIHSPRESENFNPELESKLPIAVIAQYQVRQWPELSFIVPNVVDIYDPLHMPIEKNIRHLPVVSYSPSSPGGRGWDNKSYTIVSPILKKLALMNEVTYHRIASLPHKECLKLKQFADIGIDEVSTGSYHMSSLEYLSMGVATISGIDEKCQNIVKELTGASWLPWINATEITFKNTLLGSLRTESYHEVGTQSRKWMEEFWNPNLICNYFTDLYHSL